MKSLKLSDILFFILAGLVMTAAFSNGEPAGVEGILGGLSQGQSVNLKSEPGGFVISFFDNEVELGYKVGVVGSNFVTLIDAAGTETSIPVYSIKSVVKLRRTPHLRLK